MQSKLQTLEAVRTKLSEVQQLLSSGFFVLPDLLSSHSMQEQIKSVDQCMQFYKFVKPKAGNHSDSDIALGYFSFVPNEVIFFIFSFLSWKELTTLAQVCKVFELIALDDRHWKRISHEVELNADHKHPNRSWRWLCKSKLNVLGEEEKDGVGSFTWKTTARFSNNRYEGEWKNNLRHGYGVYYLDQGSEYIGFWKEDKRHGHGVRTWPNGNMYCGNYENHKRHGEGEFIFSNGSRFTGTFEENKFSFGVYTWPNGRIYRGYWNNIAREGQGTYWWPDGRTYNGDWKEDKRHGFGVHRWQDGDEYEGHFVEGRRVGKGVLTTTTGEVYDQEWKEDRPFDENDKGFTQNRFCLTTQLRLVKHPPLSDSTANENSWHQREPADQAESEECPRSTKFLKIEKPDE